MKRSYSGYLYIVLCAVIFSTMEVMLKTVHGVFAPMQITCLRFLIGGLLLIPFALRSMKKKGAAFTRADAGFFALTGFLCVAFSMVLYQMAVTYTKASVVAIIFSCNPIFVTVLAYFLLREEIHRNHLIALALELLAVLIIIDPLHAALRKARVRPFRRSVFQRRSRYGAHRAHQRRGGVCPGPLRGRDRVRRRGQYL